MKCAHAILILFSFAVVCTGQSVADQLISNNKETACNKPATGERIYDYREGRVTGVTKENALVFVQNELNGDAKIETLRIRLVGVDSVAGGVRLNAFLKKMLAGRKITVAGNKRNESDDELTANVWTASLGDLNQHLLQHRLADFLEPEYDSVSAYSVCVLKEMSKKRTD